MTHSDGWMAFRGRDGGWRGIVLGGNFSALQAFVSSLISDKKRCRQVRTWWSIQGRGREQKEENVCHWFAGKIDFKETIHQKQKMNWSKNTFQTEIGHGNNIHQGNSLEINMGFRTKNCPSLDNCLHILLSRMEDIWKWGCVWCSMKHCSAAKCAHSCIAPASHCTTHCTSITPHQHHSVPHQKIPHTPLHDTPHCATVQSCVHTAALHQTPLC